jgi:P27 family predicted phage terminase small subunit
MTDEPLRPPRHLQTEGKRTWERLTAEYDFDPPELILLRALCEQLDVQNQARRSVRRQGLTVTSSRTGVIKPNPALSIERQATRLIASLVRQLALPVDDGKQTYTGRTPGGRRHRSPRAA